MREKLTKEKFNHETGVYQKKEKQEVCNACLKQMEEGQQYVFFPSFDELEHLDCFIWRMARLFYKRFKGL